MKTHHARLVVSSLLLALTTVPCPGQEEEGWVSLFDGKTLHGWVQRGGAATYAVEDGSIVGTTVANTPNTFLCTEKHYGNFVLELEFQVDPELNSGVQFRSNSLPDYKKGRVHGYQCEIDCNLERDRWWTAGIYEEGGRGWLDPVKGGEKAPAFTKQGRQLTRPDDWNTLRVMARGPHLQTWLNGKPRADLVDDKVASGFIGLQVHGVGKRTEPLKVRWRNIRVRPLDTDE